MVRMISARCATRREREDYGENRYRYEWHGVRFSGGGSASKLHGNYYALTVTTRLGLGGKGGMVRVGAAHYNTVEEVYRLGDALRTIES